jgi:hypothetical protein
MLVRFAPDPLDLGLGPLCPLLRLRRFAFEASKDSVGLRPRPRYALVSFSLSSRNSLVSLRLSARPFHSLQPPAAEPPRVRSASA